MAVFDGFSNFKRLFVTIQYPSKDSRQLKSNSETITKILGTNTVKMPYNVSIGKSPQKGRGDFKLPIPSLTSPTPPLVVDNNDKVTLPEDDASDTTEADIDDLREDVTNVIAEPFMTLNNKNNVIKYNQSDNDSSSHTPERKSNLGESSPIRLTSSLSSVSLSASVS